MERRTISQSRAPGDKAGFRVRTDLKFPAYFVADIFLYFVYTKPPVRYLFILFITLIAFAQDIPAQQTSLAVNTDSLKKINLAVKEANRRQMANAHIQHFVIKADSSTYGYSIYIDGKLYIQQTTIPAMPGNRGFSTVDKADKTAVLVIEKIKQGELPPALTHAELRRHKIIE